MRDTAHASARQFGNCAKASREAHAIQPAPMKNQIALAVQTVEGLGYRLLDGLQLCERVAEYEDISHFFKRFHESELSRDFGVYRLSLDALRADIQQYVIERGLSSLFYNFMTCDAITPPGFRTDEIEPIVLGIMKKLDGVKHLLIIDAFFYDDDPACLQLLKKIVSSMSSQLEKVTLITSGNRARKRPTVHAVFQKVVPAIQIKEQRLERISRSLLDQFG